MRRKRRRGEEKREKEEMDWICPEEEEPSAGERMLRSYFQVQTPPIDFSSGSIDAHLAKWQQIMSCGENGLDLAPAKAKRRKAEMVGVHGGRVVHCAGRKDRHSKVSTARGTRDRRLRLSPRTAIQFYDVQDRLGYDRPSKAIDWLMKEAKAAIDALEGTETPPAPALTNENPTNNFGFFAEPPHDSITLCQDYQDGLFDAELEMERIQRVFSWNHSGGGATPLSFPITTPVEMFSHREPLQSSSSRISTISNLTAQFPEISFSNEELVECTSAVNRTPSSSPAAFLQYEE